MFKLKNQIEAQIQEIVFFASLLMAFTVFVSGTAYLALGSDSLQLVLGSFGASIQHGFFSVFGYGYFYLAFATLHMGWITNFHIFNFNDLKREYPVLAYSALAHLILLTLFSNLLSVIQFSLETPVSDALPYGAGGLVGSFIAKGLYSIAGVYGSLLILVIFKVMTGLVAEFFELKDLHQLLKKSALVAKESSVRLAKLIQQILIQATQFFLKGNDFSDMAFQSSQATKSWISNSVNRANHLFTEQFHIYTHKEEEKTPTFKNQEKPAPQARKTVIKKTASQKLLTTVEPLITEPMKIIKNATPVTVVAIKKQKNISKKEKSVLKRKVKK